MIKCSLNFCDQCSLAQDFGATSAVLSFKSTASDGNSSTKVTVSAKE